VGDVPGGVISVATANALYTLWPSVCVLEDEISVFVV